MFSEFTERIRSYFVHPAPELSTRKIQQRIFFLEEAARRGYGNLSQYHWYHTIDLGDGLVTPGEYDYREILPIFQFPNDMSGMSVLDVGSATGFFAFEFEKRGANVVSVEIPSILDWDMPLGEEREKILLELMSSHQATTLSELQLYHFDGPFEFCRMVLNSKVTRVHSSVYNLTPDVVGRDRFDMIFCGDILLHLFSPMKALAIIAPLCKNTLVLSQTVIQTLDPRPTMLYVGGDSRKGDGRSWFLPNKACFRDMLKRLGFKKIDVVGSHSGVYGKNNRRYPSRSIIHAKK